MTSQLLQQTNRLINTIVYVDYENISEWMKQARKEPFEMEFFRVIKEKLQESGFKVIDFIVYGNFEKDFTSQRLQTQLRRMGFQAYHASTRKKSCEDLALIVDAMRTLYKSPNINVFVIVSSDRDIIPLLKTIKYENKLSYVFSTKNGFNQVVAEFADFHEYIEDIFQLTGCESGDESDELWLTAEPGNLDPEQIERAKEVARYLYNSHIWRRSLQQAEPINLNGYIQVISRVVNRSADELLDDFKLAHQLKYVAIYQDPARQLLYIKQGEKGWLLEKSIIGDPAGLNLGKGGRIIKNSGNVHSFGKRRFITR